MIEDASWDHPDAVALREVLRLEIAEAYGRGDSEPTGSETTGPDIADFVVAFRGGRGIGCGGLRLLGDGVGELKRMYVDPGARGTGVARALLRALEARAAEHQIRFLRLETGDRLVAAQRFYRSEGFVSIPPYGPYVGSLLSRCYEKPLTWPAS